MKFARVCVALGAAAGALAAAVEASSSAGSTFTYEVVTGIFKQDDPTIPPAEIGATPASFGLIDESPLRWLKLKAKILSLNLFAPRNTQYKLLFLGRHGEGWHNVAEAFYGTPAWDETWSKLDGNGTIVWGPDAQLTPLGEAQAANVTLLWEKELQAGIPIPEILYSSPMSRAAKTARISFEWLWKTGKRALILENFREVIGVHTCDERKTKTYIQEQFGDIMNIEKGFTEQDELWTADHRETNDEQNVRLKKALDFVFSHGGTYVSVTAHSGALNAAFRVMGHRDYGIPTGGVVPVLLKATKA
ncbi:phosphoglycerate mutase [Exidia glandulosa HHB12029]|uniref:Phosphoglycerate mutase n=1 Tax=Exidia glandulosa HHB12029 TaxID=1314781 RepID=A0A165N781_EXIGL|nr:phosphoglycerate mutase [Exidia glandulosa HHB12029]